MGRGDHAAALGASFSAVLVIGGIGGLAGAPLATSANAPWCG
jgi:hypothetical protein